MKSKKKLPLLFGTLAAGVVCLTMGIGTVFGGDNDPPITPNNLVVVDKDDNNHTSAEFTYGQWSQLKAGGLEIVEGYDFNASNFTGDGAGIYQEIAGDAVFCNFAVRTVTVNCYVDNNQVSSSDLFVAYNATISIDANNVIQIGPNKLRVTTNNGYNFAGLFNSSGAQITSSTTAISVTTDTTVSVKWEKAPPKITWNFNGGNTLSTNYSTTLAEGEAIIYPADNTMVKEGVGFAYWDNEVTTMPNHDITISAVWSSPLSDFTFSYTETTQGQYSAEITGYTGSDSNVILPKCFGGSLTETYYPGLWYAGGKSVRGTRDDFYKVSSNANSAISSDWIKYGDSENEGKDLPSNVYIKAAGTYDGSYPNDLLTILSSIMQPVFCNGIVFANATDAFYAFDPYREYCLTFCGTAQTFTFSSTIAPNVIVTSIEDSVFYGCTSISSINIPSSVTRIGNSAFYGCSGLTSVTFGNKTGWKAGSTSISSADLSNTSTAANYLTTKYWSVNWTRS